MQKGNTVQKQRAQDDIPDTGCWGVVEGKDRIIITARLAVSKKGYANLLRLAGNDDAIVSGVMSSHLTGLWETIDPSSPGFYSAVIGTLCKNISELQEEKHRKARA